MLFRSARLAEAIHFPLGRAALKHDPGLAVELHRDGANWSLHLRATRLAPCLLIEDRHYRADDEGFFLLPGEERTVALLPVGTPQSAPAGRVLVGYGDNTVAFG